MKTENNNVESRTPEQRGETTGETAVQNLSGTAVADLLKSEFTEAIQNPPADEEDDETPSPTAEAEESSQAGETDEATEDGSEPAEEAETAPSEEETQDADAENAAEDELPAEMRDALTEWEAKGGPLPEPLQKVVNKRIGRLTSEREAAVTKAGQLEKQLADVTGELNQLRADPARPAFSTPEGVQDEATLTKLDKASSKFLEEAEDYLDGTADDTVRGRVESYMAQRGQPANEKTLRRVIREFSEWRRESLPQQREALKQFRTLETQANSQAKAWFGKLDDKTSAEAAKAQEVLKYVPELKFRSPSHEIAKGVYVLGFKVLEALQQQGTKQDLFGALDAALAKAFPPKATVTKPKPPPKTPAGKTATVQPRGRVTAADAARTEFQKAPTRESVTNLLAAQIRGG